MRCNHALIFSQLLCALSKFCIKIYLDHMLVIFFVLSNYSGYKHYLSELAIVTLEVRKTHMTG